MVVRGRYNYCEPVGQNQASMIQDSVNELVAKSDENKFQLNKSKCGKMGICFVKIKAYFTPIIINEKAMEVVSCIVIPSCLSDELEGLQKRASRIISGHSCTCQEVLSLASIETLFE